MNDFVYAMDNDGRYTSVDGFIHDVEFSVDLQFSYAGKDYAICGCSGEWSICEVGKPSTEQTYPTLQDMVSAYTINGMPIGQVITEIEVTEAT